MIAKTIERLTHLLDTIPQMLRAIPAEEFSYKSAKEIWSKKEIIGHLIDSAANNHQRFVRGQFEDSPYIVYDQNNWNDHNFHQEASQEQVISFWEQYNRQILFIIKHISAENLQRTCRTNEPKPVTLQWLIDDYVVHMEHHLHQVISYN